MKYSYMKILSFDVGIKNLSACLLNFETNQTKNNSANSSNSSSNNIVDAEILDWQLIDMTSNTTHYCTIEKTIKKSKSKKNDKNEKDTNDSICGLKASYFCNNNNYYCKRHAKSSDFLIPDTKLNSSQLKRNSVIKLKEIIQLYSIDRSKTGTKKTDLITCIEEYRKKHFLNKVELSNSSASKDSLISLCRIMTQKLDELLSQEKYSNIDIVLIENQIGRIAVRMKSIQGMLTQYFVGKNIPQIEYISSMNKLKHFSDKKGLNYKERKAESIIVSRNQITYSNPNWINFYDNFSKKDDLADCFLQGIWYIREYYVFA